jgi:hypothetical protein
VNLAPWNIGGCAVEVTPAGVRVAGRPLVFFHFHGTKRMLLNVYESGLHDYGVALTRAIRRGIYGPYVKELGASRRQLRGLPGSIREGLTHRARPTARELARQLVSTARCVARHSTVFAAT